MSALRSSASCPSPRHVAPPARVGAVLQQGGDERGPARLMAGPQPTARVAVEVLIEEDVVAPVRVVHIAREGAVAGPRSVPMRDEQGAEPLRQLDGHAL